jgi:hypothetical protein
LHRQRCSWDWTARWRRDSVPSCSFPEKGGWVRNGKPKPCTTPYTASLSMSWSLVCVKSRRPPDRCQMECKWA